MTLELNVDNADVVIMTAPNGARLAISLENGLFDVDYMTKTKSVLLLNAGLIPLEIINPSNEESFIGIDDLNDDGNRHTPKDVDKESMYPLVNKEEYDRDHSRKYSISDDTQRGDKTVGEKNEEQINFMHVKEALKLIEVTGEIDFKSICTGAYYSVMNTPDASYNNAIIFGHALYESIKDCESTLELHPRVYKVAADAGFNETQIGIISKYVFDQITESLMKNSEVISSDGTEGDGATASRGADEQGDKGCEEKEEECEKCDESDAMEGFWKEMSKKLEEKFGPIDLDECVDKFDLNKIFQVPYTPEEAHNPCANCSSWINAQRTGQSLVCNCTIPYMNNGITCGTSGTYSVGNPNTITGTTVNMQDLIDKGLISFTLGNGPTA